MSENQNQASRLQLEGDITAERAKEIQEFCQKKIDESGTGAVMMDLKGVDFMDSTGTGVIIRMYKSCAARKRPFSVEIDSPQLHRIFQFSGLAKLLSVKMMEGE